MCNTGEWFKVVLMSRKTESVKETEQENEVVKQCAVSTFALLNATNRRVKKKKVVDM